MYNFLRIYNLDGRNGLHRFWRVAGTQQGLHFLAGGAIRVVVKWMNSSELDTKTQVTWWGERKQFGSRTRWGASHWQTCPWKSSRRIYLFLSLNSSGYNVSHVEQGELNLICNGPLICQTHEPRAPRTLTRALLDTYVTLLCSYGNLTLLFRRNFNFHAWRIVCLVPNVSVSTSCRTHGRLFYFIFIFFSVMNRNGRVYFSRSDIFSCLVYFIWFDILKICRYAVFFFFFLTLYLGDLIPPIFIQCHLNKRSCFFCFFIPAGAWRDNKDCGPRTVCPRIKSNSQTTEGNNTRNRLGSLGKLYNANAREKPKQLFVVFLQVGDGFRSKWCDPCAIFLVKCFSFFNFNFFRKIQRFHT